jgi:hypothetical protein
MVRYIDSVYCSVGLIKHKQNLKEMELRQNDINEVDGKKIRRLVVQVLISQQGHLSYRTT